MKKKSVPGLGKKSFMYVVTPFITLEKSGKK